MIRTRLFVALLGLALVASVGAPASAKKSSHDGPTLVRAAKIYTAADPRGAIPQVFAPGAMLIEDGQIVQIGNDLEAPADAETIDLGNAVVMPGIVAATSRLAGSGSAEESVAPHYRAADAFDPYANYRNVLAGGVTTAYVSTGLDRLVSGRGAVVKLTDGHGGNAQVIHGDTHLEVNLGSTSLGPPAIQQIPIPPSSDNPIPPARTQLPSTRLSQLAALREAFAAARGDTAGDLPLQALADALESGLPVRVHADAAHELLRALDAAREIGQPTVIAGALEGAEVIDELASARYPVIVEMGLSLATPPSDRSLGPDRVELMPETAANLVARGVDVAVSTPFGGSLAEIALSGALAMRGGMTREQAVAALTRVPAKILGVDDRLGSLVPGRDADFVVLADEPFGRASHVREVFVEGRASLHSGDGDRASSDAVVIRGGTVVTASGSVIDGGEILIENGRITAVGHGVAVPPNARIVNAGEGSWITPGFIDAISHLEVGNERGLGPDADLRLLIASAGTAARDVARAGVTTALIQPAQTGSSGVRVVPVKTTGDSRDHRVLDEIAALKFSWRGQQDPMATFDRFDRALAGGKKYFDTWQKYFGELKKWEEEQAKAGPKKPEPKPEDNEEEEVQTEKKADPITGKWEIEISGGPIPEPQEGSLNLQMNDAGEVTGQFAGLFGGEDNPSDVNGTFEGTTLTLKLDVPDIPIPGDIMIIAEVGDDSINGSLAIGEQFQLEIAGTRTEKVFKEITRVTKRKKREDDGRPAAPPVNNALEPYRALFGKQIPVLLDADQAISLKYATKLFVEKYELELVLVGGEQLSDVHADVAPHLKGVVAPVAVTATRDGERFVPAAEIAGAGLPTAFQSNGQNAARGLPTNAAYAVRNGMSPSAALHALTIDPAKMFHIDDRVGSLEPGKDGDVLVFSGDPFDLSTRLLHVFVGGVEVEPEED